MKNRGLQNRFSQKTRMEWLYWNSCMVCGRNQQDILHHIISPSSQHFVIGEHNTSVFNSSPVHNFKCHIGNESWLYDEKNITKLLNKTANAMLFLDYNTNKNDEEFLRIYDYLYNGNYAYPRELRT